MCSDFRSRVPTTCNSEVRNLTEIEELKLKSQDSRLVSYFVEQKLQENARKNWDVFYKRNSTKFFKDRHWTTSEFKELLGCNDLSSELSLLEVGCGVGNLLFPLIEEGVPLKIFACDFSSRAIDFVKNHPKFNSDQISAFEGDITSPDFINLLKSNVMDIVTMVFVLSAIHPSKFIQCAKNLFLALRENGVLLIRDYAINDMTQIRFKAGNKIRENFYMRQDGTCTHFFSIESLRSIFSSVGFKEEFCYYVHSRTVNKKEGVDAPRTFIQAKYSKPPKELL